METLAGAVHGQGEEEWFPRLLSKYSKGLDIFVRFHGSYSTLHIKFKDVGLFFLNFYLAGILWLSGGCLKGVWIVS